MKTLVPEFLKTYKLYSIIVVCMCSLVGMAQDGQNDFTFNIVDKVAAQGTDNSVTVATVLSDNKIVIAGAFTKYNGVTANKLARINVDGKIDKSFNAGLGTDGTINSVAVQPNFKMIIAGDFSSYDGYPANKIARVNANGTLDRTFFAGAVGANNSITKVLIQPDGKIIVGGNFTTYNNKPAKGVVRLNKNGTVDLSFSSALTDSIISIHQIAVLPDGKLIVAGKAKNFFGDLRNFIDVLRLNPDGSRDYSFTECIYSVGDLYPKINSIGIENNGNILLAETNQDNGSSNPYHGLLMRFNTNGEMINLTGTFWINSMVLQNDGKIVALGFDNPDWNIIKRVVVRMNEDLTIDSTFALDDKKIFGDPNECSIQALAIQSGKLIIGGNFFEINGLTSGNIARLNNDGSFDDTFNQRKGCNGGVFTSAKQSDGKLIIGGEFTKFNSQPATNIARLNIDGSIDLGFKVGNGTNGKVNAIEILPSGKILIGGEFTSYNGHACNNLARLCENGKFDQSFKTPEFDGSVRKLVIDKNNNILVGGDFIHVNDQHRNAFARLSENGTLDASFQPLIEETGSVYDCKISNDDKIYVAINYRNTPELNIPPQIHCLNSNGSPDNNFHFRQGILTEINSIVLTDEKKVLAAGLGHYTVPSFFWPKGIIVRLDEFGDIDSTFDYKPLENYLDKKVRTISVLMQDKIIIGGDFSVDKTSMNHVGMLNMDGSINFDFVGNTNGNVHVATITENNKLLLGGTFSEYASYVRNGVARISFDVLDPMPQAAQRIDNDVNQLNIYPNPAIASVTIDHMQLGSAIKIYNVAGVEMFSGIVSSEMETIDVSSYSNGVYFITTEKNGATFNSKFIVNK